MIERGSKIGRFVVVTELGRGGMGAVYAAHDPQLDRQVALKVMRNASGEEEDRVRMLREGQAMARVTHPNVITVYEVGTEAGSVFLAQELLDAGTLREWLDKPHSERAIIDKLIAAGRGLAAAHKAGLVHRDFKPENVLLGKDGRVRVADFGLASAAHALVESMASTRRGGGPQPDLAHAETSPMSPLTRTGAVMGTPMFMAPEQHLGERADARSDQFAFCVSLYHALYKAWPFDGKTAPALADAVIEGRLAPAPKNADVSPRLRKIMVRGLATDPAQRYPTMDELLTELEQLARPPNKSRVPLFVAGALIAVAGAAASIFLLGAKDTPAVVAPPAPPPSAFEDMLTSKGIVWLTSAIDRGELDDAIEKYDMAASGLQADGPKAAMAGAAGAYMRVLRGELDAADAKLQLAATQAGADPIAKAYVDLADAALLTARGKLLDAEARSRSCAAQLETTAAVLAAICYQLQGDAQAGLGDAAGARKAYEAGLAIAKQTSAEQNLLLAVSQLDLDAQQWDKAAETARQVQASCDKRHAVGCEVQARIQLARVTAQAGDSSNAVTMLAQEDPATIQTYGVRIAYEIALGEAHENMHETGDDAVAGLDQIEAARAKAEKRGFVILMLEAKLARVGVLLRSDDPTANSEYKSLVEQARAAKIERIAKLAEASFAELSEAPRAMLPADGGLPAVHAGSSGPP